MLKKLFIYFFREYLFWMVFFFICRSIFLVYNFDEMKEISFGEILSAFWQALYLDTSLASYFLGFTFFIFSIHVFFPKKIFINIYKIYVIILLVLLSLITIAELEIYNEWGTKLNVKAIKFLEHPSEVISSTRTSFLILGCIAVGILSSIGYFLHKKIMILPNLTTRQSANQRFHFLTPVLFVLITPVVLILGIRGGIQPIPIQQSDAYFSKYNVLNLASVNSAWNLGQSIWENNKLMGENPYQYYSLDEAKKTVSEIYRTEKDTTVSILKTNKPNIVLVVLEGWSADLVKSLGGYDNVTPCLEKIISEGILFENCYASGSLSDQGMSSVFSAFPAQPTVSIISQPNKYVHLPCITNELDSAGYATSFLFGGQLSYGNIKAYMYYNKFDRILEGKDFESSIPHGKLGVHDEYLYECQLKELRDEKQPFFAGMFTMSSHSPFDMPMEENKKLNFGGDEKNYVNSVHYADEKLYNFLQKAKKEKWFDNTLFILVSDHGHRSPKQYSINQPEYRKIPMVFWGKVLRDEYKGYRYKKICSQIDLGKTLLHQFGISSARYEWSKNLFNPYTSEFAYFETTDGFGWVRPEQYIVYSHIMNQYYFEKTNSPEEKVRLEKEGKSFLQAMFQEYTDY